MRYREYVGLKVDLLLFTLVGSILVAFQLSEQITQVSIYEKVYSIRSFLRGLFKLYMLA